LCAWSFSQKEQIHKRNIALLLLCIPLAYYLSSHFFIFEWNGLGHTQRRINETNLNELSSGRVEIWQWAIAAIKEQPWFGHGLYGFYFLEARKASEFIYDHPHNSLLQMAVEWGIPASLALISILATLFFQAIKRMFYANVKTDFTIAVCLIAYLSMHSLTSASYWSLQPLNVLILAFAIIACCLQHQEQPKQAK
jgi:O-antigen ligase